MKPRRKRRTWDEARAMALAVQEARKDCPHASVRFIARYLRIKPGLVNYYLSQKCKAA